MQQKEDGYSFIPGDSLCMIKMLFQTMNESTVFFQMDYNFITTESLQKGSVTLLK